MKPPFLTHWVYSFTCHSLHIIQINHALISVLVYWLFNSVKSEAQWCKNINNLSFSIVGPNYVDYNCKERTMTNSPYNIDSIAASLPCEKLSRKNVSWLVTSRWRVAIKGAHASDVKGLSVGRNTVLTCIMRGYMITYQWHEIEMMAEIRVGVRSLPYPNFLQFQLHHTQRNWACNQASQKQWTGRIPVHVGQMARRWR